MELTRRQLIAAVPLAIGALALTGCGSDPQATAGGSGAQQQAQTQPQPPLDLSGTWRQPNSADPDNSWMEAVITADSISVNWVMDAGATAALYWQGTYAAPTGPSDTYSWTSTGTLDPTAVNIMASQDASKDFTCTGGKLTWQQSALGVTTTIECERV